MTRDAIENREILRKERKLSASHEQKFREKRKQVKLMIKRDVKIYEVRLMESAINRGRGQREARKGFNRGKEWICKLTKENSQVTFDRDEILEESAKFYEKVLSSTFTKEEREAKCPDLSKYQEVEEISIEEMREALSSMKNNRSPGDDGITSELIKLCDNQALSYFCKLFNKILSTEKIPEDWLTSTIILIHKKGDKSQLSDY